jgi:hypothetical protein
VRHGRLQPSPAQVPTAIAISRYKIPNGQSACFTDCAATLRVNACPARFLVFKVLFFNTFPPEISCLGASPSHEQKCFSLGNFPISVPTSMITVCASETPKPSTKLISTLQVKCWRISPTFFGAFLLPVRSFEAVPFAFAGYAAHGVPSIAHDAAPCSAKKPSLPADGTILPATRNCGRSGSIVRLRCRSFSLTPSAMNAN